MTEVLSGAILIGALLASLLVPTTKPKPVKKVRRIDWSKVVH